MKLFKSLIAILLVILTSTNVHAQNGNSQFYDVLDGRFDVSGYLSENAYGFLPVPIIITDPAVDGGLGIIGLFFHETDEEKDKRLSAMQKSDTNAFRHLIPPSVSAVAVVGTGNESWFTGGGHMGYFNQGKIRYTGGGGYGNLNLDFYGYGGIELPRPVEFNTSASLISQTLKFKIADSPFYLGIGQRYIDAKISLKSSDNIDSILPPAISDVLKSYIRQDVTTSALGINFEFDTRNNIFSPSEGYQYTIDYFWFRDNIGSDIEYELSSFQGLNYWPVSDNWQLGLKVASEYARSDQFLPPFATPGISLRGIPTNRYQGNFVVVMETEVIWRIDSRWSTVAFAGVGRASDNTSEFSDATNRESKGFGFRYHIARRYELDAGVDLAWGPDDFVFYITAGSAWGR